MDHAMPVAQGCLIVFGGVSCVSASSEKSTFACLLIDGWRKAAQVSVSIWQ